MINDERLMIKDYFYHIHDKIINDERLMIKDYEKQACDIVVGGVGSGR